MKPLTNEGRALQSMKDVKTEYLSPDFHYFCKSVEKKHINRAKKSRESINMQHDYEEKTHLRFNISRNLTPTVFKFGENTNKTTSSKSKLINGSSRGHILN